MSKDKRYAVQVKGSAISEYWRVGNDLWVHFQDQFSLKSAKRVAANLQIVFNVQTRIIDEHSGKEV